MAQIMVPGDVSVKNVKEFHAMVRDAMEGDGAIVLDFRDVTRVDLAIMQVLIALSRECGEKNRGLRVRAASPEIRNQLRISGVIP
ncbi:MAG: STAS domain-containing protein [Spirochaetes bacterium]|nr:STAS domain-containing protein [Spirochaetota bacterium]